MNAFTIIARTTAAQADSWPIGVTIPHPHRRLKGSPVQWFGLRQDDENLEAQLAHLRTLPGALIEHVNWCGQVIHRERIPL